MDHFGLREQPMEVLRGQYSGLPIPANSEIVLTLLRNLNETLGQTILMITHNPEAAEYGHRIVRMRDGRIA